MGEARQAPHEEKALRGLSTKVRNHLKFKGASVRSVLQLDKVKISLKECRFSIQYFTISKLRSFPIVSKSFRKCHI